MWVKSTFGRARRPILSPICVLALLVGSGCGIFGDDDLPPMTLERLDGPVTVTRGGETIPVTGERSIEPGDVIETGEDGVAEFSLDGERLVKLAPRTRVRVTSTSALESLGGSLLADTGERTTVRFGAVEASSHVGTFRVDTGFASARAASLDGVLDLSVTGEAPLAVDPFFEARVAANDLPGITRPYRFDPSDIFDKERLGKWVELDRTLNQLGDGLSTQLGRSRPNLDYFSDRVGGREVGFMRPFLRRPAGQLLIGLSIAANSDPGLRPGFVRGMDLFDQGGAWGIVAAILRAENVRAVVAEVRGAIEDTGTVAGGQRSEPDFVASTGAGSSGGDGDPASGDDGGTGGGDGGGGDELGDEPSDPQPAPTPPEDECEDNTVGCTLAGLGVQPAPSPTSLLSGG